MLEKTLPLDCKKIHPVHPKGNQSWIFIGRTAAEAETPILWPPDAKSWLIGKDPDARKDWGHEEKGTTEDEMAGWHHWLNGCEFERTLGVGDGQGGLACCDSWGHKESDTTERLNWTEVLIKCLLTVIYAALTKFFNQCERKHVSKIMPIQCYARLEEFGEEALKLTSKFQRESIILRWILRIEPIGEEWRKKYPIQTDRVNNHRNTEGLCVQSIYT